MRNSSNILDRKRDPLLLLRQDVYVPIDAGKFVFVPNKEPGVTDVDTFGD